MQAADDALAIAIFVIVSPRVQVVSPEPDRVVEKHGKLASRRGYSLGLARSSREATVKGTKGGLSSADVDRSDPKQSSRSTR
jgi:hypothetical protein